MLNAIWEELQQVCECQDGNPFLTMTNKENHLLTGKQDDFMLFQNSDLLASQRSTKSIRLEQEREEMLEAMRFLMDEIISLKEELATVDKLKQGRKDMEELVKFLMQENSALKEQLAGASPLGSMQRSKCLEIITPPQCEKQAHIVSGSFCTHDGDNIPVHLNVPKNSANEMDKTLRRKKSWQTPTADTRHPVPSQVSHYFPDLKNLHAGHLLDSSNRSACSSRSDHVDIGHFPASKDNICSSRSSSVNELLDLLESSTCDANDLLEEFNTPFRRSSGSSSSITTVSSAASDYSRNSLLEGFGSQTSTLIQSSWRLRCRKCTARDPFF
eukprot:CAMPEP_0172420340 /NCGR_PEP_ID=MMETSP1064-20121228/6720_1 /TAXON_ID=202472 /ORGANISM="Aulacoseira subarctica , Strain CCAP 1002/5" /LENGTH=327 /DNA_ID=CAMNT_0013160263 /DNA_START=235 /DNA_END=1218 /DNA_ORIENTATION=-